ncbi:MAG: class I SAM-dependent methyltransferase [Xanthomonadales bacterium]|mgnify:CR=1 FL=1|nr:class I SAM-dependent methyltransferase [Xanthomonadales bacterium]
MAEYSLGHSPAEQQRLQRQAALLRNITQTIWRRAGLEPGMRVLDVGCGVGDTSFLAADMVGVDGMVVGQDRSPEALATARQRAAELGLDHVEFVEGELGSWPGSDERFDAIVGRYVLIHQPDIEEALLKLRPMLRPDGGIIAFHELELEARTMSDPASELVLQVRGWLRQAFKFGGMQAHGVMDLSRCFFEAGFGWPQVELYPLVGCGPDSFAPAYLVEILRTVAPTLEKHGVIKVDELGLDTLEARLRESCANGAPGLVQINGGAWARI